MKKIKIGKTEYELCETAEDLPIKRFTALKHYMIYKETGVTIPSLINTVSGFVKGFDNESKADMLITLHNYVTGLQQVQDDFDPDQMVFALICFEKDEDKINWDETKGKEKLERMAQDGLDQRFVEETTVNFIKSSQAHFVSSLRKSLTKEMPSSVV